MQDHFALLKHNRLVDRLEVRSPGFEVSWIGECDVDSDVCAVGVHADPFVVFARVLDEVRFVVVSVAASAGLDPWVVKMHVVHELLHEGVHQVKHVRNGFHLAAERIESGGGTRRRRTKGRFS